MLRKFNPAGVVAPATYCQGVEATSFQKMLFISGQVGIKPDGSPAEGIHAQTTTAVANMKAVLAGAGMDISDIAKFTVFLTDETMLGGFMEAGRDMMPSPPTAITLVYVKALASPALLVEIEAIAVK